MKKSVIQAQEQAAHGYLAHKGYLDPAIFTNFYLQRGFHFLQSLSDVAKNLQWSSKKSKIAAVSQVKAILQNSFGVLSEMQSLEEMKRMDLTRILTKILLPDPEKRQEINSLRLKILKQLRKNSKVEESEIKMLDQFYSLITFGRESINMSNIKEMKKSLTSMKKLMGSQEVLEQEERRDKKKAYQENLMIREIIEVSLKNMDSPLLQKKAVELLKSPKNKKWFGIRLYKLLVEQKWSSEEMQILAQQINKIKSQEKVKEIKLRYIRAKLSKISKKIMEQSQLGDFSSSRCTSEIFEGSMEEQNSEIIAEQVFNIGQQSHIEQSDQNQHSLMMNSYMLNMAENLQFSEFLFDSQF